MTLISGKGKQVKVKFQSSRDFSIPSNVWGIGDHPFMGCSWVRMILEGDRMRLM